MRLYIQKDAKITLKEMLTIVNIESGELKRVMELEDNTTEVSF